MSRLPVVAIVGRPNVGKSTLFNRLARRRVAIVDDMPGVTRDRIYTMARPPGARFHLIDTGGLDPDSTDVFLVGIREQARMAIEEADVVVHVCDARAGLHPDDRFVAGMLRSASKPTVTVANKIDGKNSEDLLPEMYELGVDEVLGVSSAHGTGFGELVEKIVAKMPDDLRKAVEDAADLEESAPRGRAARRAAAAEAEELAPPPVEGERPEEFHIPNELRIAVVGKPNAGKSSLVNAILGEPRLLVSEIAGTTRDAVDTLLVRDGRNYRLVDTAGLRRKRSVALKLEKYSVVAAVRALEEADIVLLVVDGYEGVTDQDAKIAELANDRGKGLVVVVNKWDLVDPEVRKKRADYAARVRKELGFVSFAPVIFISALTKEGVPNILPTIDEVARHHYRRVSTGRLNKSFQKALESHHLPSHHGKKVSLYYATQVTVAPPTIVIACNNPDGVHFSYRRYLLNALRDDFGFVGTPVRLIFKRRGKDIGARRKRTQPRPHG